MSMNVKECERNVGIACRCCAVLCCVVLFCVVLCFIQTLIVKPRHMCRLNIITFGSRMKWWYRSSPSPTGAVGRVHVPTVGLVAFQFQFARFAHVRWNGPVEWKARAATTTATQRSDAHRSDRVGRQPNRLIESGSARAGIQLDAIQVAPSWH